MHWKSGVPTESECTYLLEHPAGKGAHRYSLRYVGEEGPGMYRWKCVRWAILEDETDYDAVRSEEALDDLRIWAREGEPLTPFHEWKAGDVLEHVTALETRIAELESIVSIKEQVIKRLRRDLDELNILKSFERFERERAGGEG